MPRYPCHPWPIASVRTGPCPTVAGRLTVYRLSKASVSEIRMVRLLNSCICRLVHHTFDQRPSTGAPKDRQTSAHAPRKAFRGYESFSPSQMVRGRPLGRRRRRETNDGAVSHTHPSGSYLHASHAGRRGGGPGVSALVASRRRPDLAYDRLHHSVLTVGPTINAVQLLWRTPSAAPNRDGASMSAFALAAGAAANHLSEEAGVC